MTDAPTVLTTGMVDLKDKVVAITGGASGIGKAVGREFGRLGGALVLADVNRAVLDDTVAEFRADGLTARGVVVDVRDADAVTAFVRGVVESNGRIDYLFNNAGINIAGELRDTTTDDWNRLIDVNLRGVVHGVQAAYPIMREQGFGHIVNTASLAGIVPTIAEGAYSATKHAVVALTMVLRSEAELFGVKANVICPGVIDTPLMQTSEIHRFETQDLLDLLPQKPMPVEVCAQHIMRGLRRDKPIIVVTASAGAFWRLYRLAPQRSLAFFRPLLAKLRKHRQGD